MVGRLHPAPRFARGTLACLLFGAALSGCAPVNQWLAAYHVDRGESLMRADDLETALVEFRELLSHRLEMLLVRIPASVVNGYIRDAAFDQPASHQTCLAKSVHTVAFSEFLFFLGNIEYLARIAQDQVISLFFTLLHRRQLRIAFHCPAQGVELV